MSLAVEKQPVSNPPQANSELRCDEPIGSGLPDREAHRQTAPAASHDPSRHGLLQAIQSLVYIIVIALFIITFTVQPFRIPSESMEPTLLVGDFLLVNKQVSNSQRSILTPASVIHRGDLIVFHYPVDPSLHLVKRVIGLPGDHIRLREGHAYIDGHPLSEPYVIFRPSVADTYRDFFPRMTSPDPGVDSRWWIQMHQLVSNGEITVPPDSYFVLGDNRNDSEDSRYWGFVPRSAIVGKPFLIYFSLKTPDNLPAPLASANAGVVAGRQPISPAASLSDFARWDRALRVIR